MNSNWLHTCTPARREEDVTTELRVPDGVSISGLKEKTVVGARETALQNVRDRKSTSGVGLRWHTVKSSIDLSLKRPRPAT